MADTGLKLRSEFLQFTPEPSVGPNNSCSSQDELGLDGDLAQS